MLMRHASGAVSVVDFSYESRKLPDPFPETLVEIEGPNGAIVVEAGLKMRVTAGGKTCEEDIGTPLLPWTSRPWHVAQESVLATCRHMLESFPRRTAGGHQRRRQSQDLCPGGSILRGGGERPRGQAARIFLKAGASRPAMRWRIGKRQCPPFSIRRLSIGTVQRASACESR